MRLGGGLGIGLKLQFAPVETAEQHEHAARQGRILGGERHRAAPRGIAR